MAKRKSPTRSRSQRGKSQPVRVTSRKTPRVKTQTATRTGRALARKPRKSASHVKGWETRRKNERAAARKRSAAKRAGRIMKGAERARERLHPETKEFQVSARYTKKNGASTGHSGTVQASIIAPRGTPVSELRQALIDHLKGKASDFAVSSVEWRSRVR